MLYSLLIVLLGVSPGPVSFPSDSSNIKSPVVGRSPGHYEGGYHLGATDWYGLSGTSCKADAAYALICTGGVSQTPEGVASSAGSPFYPLGYTAAAAASDPSIGQQKSVRYDGSTSAALGNVASLVAGGFVCSRFKASTVTGDANLMGRWDSGEYQWTVWRNGATLKFAVSKSKTDPTGANLSTLTLGTITAGAWNAACVSYNPTGAEMRGVLNGTTATAITNAVTPPILGASQMRVATGATGHWAGDVADVMWGDGAKTDAALGVAVASQLGLLASKPAGTALPFSRADVGFTCPVLDSECYWVGAGIPEIDRRGIWVGGVSENTQPTSVPDCTHNAVCDGASTITPNSASCPLAPDGTSRMSLFAGATVGQGFYANTAGGSRSMWLAKASGDADCTIDFNLYNSTDPWLVSLTGTPTRFQRSAVGVGAYGYWVERLAGSTCAQWCFWGVQINATPVPTPYRSTAGSAYTGPATTHQGIPPRTDAETWVNTILQSEDISATWTNVNTAEAVNTAVASDGSFSADKLYENDTTNGVHYLTQNYTATAVPWTASMEAKAAERSWVLLSPDGFASGYYFNLSTCTVGSMHGTGVTDAFASSLGDGWCRVGLTRTMSAGATSVRVYLSTGDTVNSYAGVANSGLYLTRLQATATSTEKPYCPTGASASTCGTSGGVGKAVTNLIPTNETLAGAAWTGSTVPVAVADPFGGTSAFALTETGWGARYTNGGLVASSAAGTYIVGTWAKMDGGAGKIRFIDSTAAATICDIDLNTTDWAFYKCSGSVVAGHVLNLTVYPAGGSGTHTMSVARMQLERATFAGRYCGPTGAAAKTCDFVERAAKPWAFSMTASVNPWTWANYAAPFSWNTGDAVNSATVYARAGGFLSNYVVDGAAVSKNAAWTHNYTAGSEHTIRLENDGVTPTLSSDGIPTGIVFIGNGAVRTVAPTLFYLGSSSSTPSNPLCGWIKSWASCKESVGCK